MMKHRGALSAVLLGAISAIFACQATPTDGYPSLGESTTDAPPMGDAAVDAAVEGATAADAREPSDAPVTLSEAQADSYPLSRCLVAQDVFYIDVEGPAGPLQLGEITRIGLDAGTSWYVMLQPELDVMLATPTGPVGDVQVWTPDSTPVVPGTYPQGPSTKGPQIDIDVVEEGCHLSSGTLTVVDLQYDWPDGDTSGDVTSLLLSFDLVCDTNDTLRGCVRYSL
jgi:hypothetical protein